MSDYSRIIIKHPGEGHLHLHVHDCETICAISQHSSLHFGCAINWENLGARVARADDVVAYRDRCLAAIPKSHEFQLLIRPDLAETMGSNDLACLIKGARSMLEPTAPTTNTGQFR